MARYDLLRGWFKTPRGKRVFMHHREGTNDWNTCEAALSQDEYGLADHYLSGTVIDIGGHIGAVSIGMAVDNPDAHVIVVEPIPENVDMIRANAAMNDVAGRITVWHGLIGDGGEDYIRYRFEGAENELHHAYVGNTTIVETDVPHQRILMRSWRPDAFPAATFMKIDCEGGEWPFFTAGVPDVPYIVGEIHPVGIAAGGLQRTALQDLIGHLYDLTFTGPEEGPEGFRAVRREPDAGGS